MYPSSLSATAHDALLGETKGGQIYKSIITVSFLHSSYCWGRRESLQELATTQMKNLRSLVALETDLGLPCCWMDCHLLERRR